MGLFKKYLHENIAQEDSETNEKSNSAENSKEEIGKNEQAEVKDTQDNIPVKEEPVSDNTNQENVQENGNQNITSNVEKNDKKNQEKESPEQEVAVPEFKAEKVKAVVVNGKIQVTVSTKDENYDKIYIGKKEDSEKTPEVKGEKNDLGGYDFVFETEAGNLGQKLQYVPHLTEKNEWYSEKDMFLDMPAEAQFSELVASINEVAGADLLCAGEVQSREVASTVLVLKLKVIVWLNHFLLFVPCVAIGIDVFKAETGISKTYCWFSPSPFVSQGIIQFFPSSFFASSSLPKYKTS